MNCVVHTQNIPDFEDLCKKEIDPDSEKTSISIHKSLQ